MAQATLKLVRIYLLGEYNSNVVVCCDNRVPIHIASNIVFHETIKHTEPDCPFGSEKIQ